MLKVHIKYLLPDQSHLETHGTLEYFRLARTSGTEPIAQNKLQRYIRLPRALFTQVLNIFQSKSFTDSLSSLTQCEKCSSEIKSEFPLLQQSVLCPFPGSLPSLKLLCTCRQQSDSPSACS